MPTEEPPSPRLAPPTDDVLFLTKTELAVTQDAIRRRAEAAEAQLVALTAERNALETAIAEGRCCDDYTRLPACGHPRCVASEGCEICVEISDALATLTAERDTLQEKFRWATEEVARLWAGVQPDAPPCGHIQTVVSVALAMLRERDDVLRHVVVTSDMATQILARYSNDLPSASKRTLERAAELLEPSRALLAGGARPRDPLSKEMRARVETIRGESQRGYSDRVFDPENDVRLLLEIVDAALGLAAGEE